MQGRDPSLLVASAETCIVTQDGFSPLAGSCLQACVSGPAMKAERRGLMSAKLKIGTGTSVIKAGSRTDIRLEH